MNLTELEIKIEGFSGPFDLLCSLVENGKFQISEIKISQLIKIYGLYLLKTRQAPADTLAEFFYMTAGLLLEKAKSLLPGAKPLNENDAPEKISPYDEEIFLKSLERYKPYRKAYQFLNEKFISHSKSFRRQAPERKINIMREIIIEDQGLYLLAKNWKTLHEQHGEFLQARQLLLQAQEGADWNGFAMSDQKQIEERISELQTQLEISNSISLNEICKGNRHALVVTLLALLELCRMGKAYIEQKELFSDVRIISKS